MALTDFQQVFELLNRSKKSLIITNQNQHGDAIAGALALHKFLASLGHETDIVCHNYKQLPTLKFLAQEKIKSQLGANKKFLISVDLSETGLKSFHYDQADGKLNFYLSPEKSLMKSSQVSFGQTAQDYDLIFVLGASDLSELGEPYLTNADFFHSAVKINLDASAHNEYFGGINLVNLAASSVSEIVYNLISEYDSELIDSEIATHLLFGIISATKNFKTANVSPKTLNLAGTLISRGAARDQIIQQLYQSRFLSTLKLWGRVLSRLNSHFNDRIISSALTISDFLETATSPDELPDVVEELIVSMPKTEVIVLIFEKASANEPEIAVQIYAQKSHDALQLAGRFNPHGTAGQAEFVQKNTTLLEAEAIIIEEIKNQLA